MKQRNETIKQQQTQFDVAEDQISFEKLKAAGFDDDAARRLSAISPDCIQRQIDWLPLRGPRQNPLGLLRCAIEQNWAEPTLAGLPTNSAHSPAGVFARYFYAGYADNEGEPTAEPSAGDVVSAERYVARLIEIWPNSDRFAIWGRDFGRMAHRQLATRNVIPSLVLALRVCGDSYIVRHQSNREESIRSEHVAARAEQEAVLKPQWFAYLSAVEHDFRNSRSQDYAAFETHRRNQHNRIVSSPFQYERDGALTYFATDESRLLAFREFFKDEVLAFWDWCEKQTVTVV